MGWNNEAKFRYGRITKTEIAPWWVELRPLTAAFINLSETLHYEALCREEVKQPELYCFYHTGSQDDYWLLLGPVRTEVLNENPRIVRFYEVMHDWEIEHIRSISQNVMERSQVLDKGGRAKSYERNVFKLTIFNGP